MIDDLPMMIVKSTNTFTNTSKQIWPTDIRVSYNLEYVHMQVSHETYLLMDVFRQIENGQSVILKRSKNILIF